MSVTILLNYFSGFFRPLGSAFLRHWTLCYLSSFFWDCLGTSPDTCRVGSCKTEKRRPFIFGTFLFAVPGFLLGLNHQGWSCHLWAVLSACRGWVNETPRFLDRDPIKLNKKAFAKEQHYFLHPSIHPSVCPAITQFLCTDQAVIITCSCFWSMRHIAGSVLGSLRVLSTHFTLTTAVWDRTSWSYLRKTLVWWVGWQQCFSALASYFSLLEN